ncbi:MAG: hypothetical protein AAF934_04650 [Bacteroidota bacterium]
MNLDQRKIALINWITTLDNESILSSVEDVKRYTTQDIPGKIISLLQLSDKAGQHELTVHTSAKDLING